MGRITLWGWYQYDKTLFDDCNLPVGIDKESLINLLMERSGMLYTYTQQPKYLKLNITNWFNRKEAMFTKMYAALTAEYNPVENYDRNEEWTDTPDVSYAKTGGHTSVVEGNNTTTDIREVSAYNTQGYSPDGKSTVEDVGQNTDTFTYQNESTRESGTRKHAGRIHGNIGVTTNQQMVTAELELRRFDIYEYIVKLFEADLLVQVY